MMTFPTSLAPESVQNILGHIPHISVSNAAVACIAVFALLKLVRVSRKRVRTHRLRGPPSPSFLYGAGKMQLQADDPASVYESWAKEYGAVFEMPTALGGHRIVLYDPKALAHFHSKDTSVYVRPPATKKSLELGVIRARLVLGRRREPQKERLQIEFKATQADSSATFRQRKSLTPAFSVAALRDLMPIFYDSAYKAKRAWNTLIEANNQDSTVIEVQNWMNHISLDTIGLAGFSHDFGALEGKESPVASAFASSTSSGSASVVAALLPMIVLTQMFPVLLHIPSSRSKMRNKLMGPMEDISNVLLARTRKELEVGSAHGHEEKSIIGLLIKGESVGSAFRLSKEEVLAQMKLLLFAGYETTSITMTWALIELSRNPDIQTKLRNELLDHGSDPTYDQLANSLRYLDAVVHEVLRLHAPIRETERVASTDDVLPLSKPLRTKSGRVIDSLPIAAGTKIVAPTTAINCSKAIWGEDAQVFKPSRWLEGQHGIPAKAREVQGHRHLLTFSDGPRSCLGKNFAIAEIKAVLSVLVKSFVFEMRDGPETKLEMCGILLPRPRVAGEEGCNVPLRVKPYTGLG